MCSLFFLRTRRKIEADRLATANRFQQRRGPDATEEISLQDRDGFHLTFLHNLLDISGSFATQPRVRGNSHDGSAEFLLFNGEIYNFDASRYVSDTDFLSELLHETQSVTPGQLDGEFAIAHYQQARSKLVVLTDPFLTKPLYMAQGPNGEFGLASYASVLQELGFVSIDQLEPNARYEISLLPESVNIQKIGETYTFALPQFQNSFEAWEKAFLAAVEKRATHGSVRPYLNLSSGYDSGAICCALNLLNIPYDTLSIRAGESYDVLERRLIINRQASCENAYVYDGVPKKNIGDIQNEIRRVVEPFVYVHEDGPGIHLSLQEDGGAIGVAYLAQEAQKKGLKVSLSGAGADEIISDYGFQGNKIYDHSEFGGLFPEHLEGFFPWKKFYGDTQRSYLFKEEFILGAYAIEGRYPFLDASLVQSFLSLSATLKNSEYKAPIAYFLRKHGYPFEPNKKRGFAPKREKLSRRLRAKIRYQIQQLFHRGA